ADGSWGFPPVRVGRRQAILKRSAILGWSFLCCKYGLQIKPGSALLKRKHEEASKIRATGRLMRKGNKIKSVGVFINVKLQ
ncbi:hypothetical protein ACFCVU_29145, partial [Peribacillus butanolivorans]|uniref:hypothetical protein n=1 Tax=Peribacillus butanolivorans TaxID=421767 RepID=UPI0035D58747